MPWFRRPTEKEIRAKEVANAAAKGLVESGHDEERLGGRFGQEWETVWVRNFVTPEVAQQRKVEREAAEVKRKQEWEEYKIQEPIRRKEREEAEKKREEAEKKQARDKKLADCKAFIAQVEAEDANPKQSAGKRFITKRNKRGKRKTRRV